MINAEAFIALNRFGYGCKNNQEYDFISNKEALIRQVENSYVPQDLVDTSGLELAYNFLKAKKSGNFSKVEKRDYRKELLLNYKRFIFDLTLVRMHSNQPFIERLNSFWSNHFCVSIEKPSVLPLIRDYEFKAIRPNITGKFEDMLIAVISHPAMLAYLDNWTSFGPNSRIGTRSGKGLNENLAREILELHTVGVEAGYTQADVIALSKMLTGWSVEKREGIPYPIFEYHQYVHEPGSKTFLGKTFPEDGMQEALNALRFLATHPKTARHLATKMATYFISDSPSADLISIMVKAYMKSSGNLGAMTCAMIQAKESWNPNLAKIKTTNDFMISVFLALGIEPTLDQCISSLDSMGFYPYKAPDPQGFPDKNEYWASSGAILKRIEWSQDISRRFEKRINPLVLGKKILGDYLSENTAQIIKGAESQMQGLILLFMSPEFQRR